MSLFQKTALRYGVVSGCFVRGVSSSFRLRPDLAPKRGLEAQSWLLERLKVRAKSMQNLLGHSGLAGSEFAARTSKDPPEWRSTAILERPCTFLETP